MNKYIVTICLFIIASHIQAQSRNELANSKVFVRVQATGDNKPVALQLRTDLNDTLINQTRYQKYVIEDFTDYAAKRDTTIFYESFRSDTFSLLDANFSVIHQFNYLATTEQTGILFRKSAQLIMEPVDTRNSFPRDSLITTMQTPRKFMGNNNTEQYVIIIPDLRIMAVASDGQYYVKGFYGDNYNQITQGLKTGAHASTRYDIQTGDEIQLLYRRKWYNDTTGLAEYENKQFMNVKYIGDTVINNQQALKLESTGYHYLSGTKNSATEIYVMLADSGYQVGPWFIPFKEYATELRIHKMDSTNYFLLQGVVNDTAGEHHYPKIVQVMGNDPYRYFILPFFPMPFIEFGNVQGTITYKKIKGKESGTKLLSEEVTDKTHIREITIESPTVVSINIYSVEAYAITITVASEETGKIIGQLKTNSKIGAQQFKVKVKPMVSKKNYGVHIDYQGKQTTGSMSDGIQMK